MICTVVKIPAMRKRVKRDPYAPKGKQTPYFCFTSTKRTAIKEQNPEAKSQEVAKVNHSALFLSLFSCGWCTVLRYLFTPDAWRSVETNDSAGKRTL